MPRQRSLKRHSKKMDVVFRREVRFKYFIRMITERKPSTALQLDVLIGCQKEWMRAGRHCDELLG
jgi:hypothetical protein